MLKRLISSLVGIPLLLGLSYLGGGYTGLLVIALTLGAVYEVLQLGQKMGIKPWYAVVAGGVVLWLVALFFGGQEFLFPATIAWLIVVLLYQATQFPRITIADTCYNFFAVMYTAALFSHLYLLRQLPQGIEWVFFTFFLVWSTDTGAYLVGMTWGKRKLAPEISPNKSVEGSVGGLVFALLIGIVGYFWIGGSLPFFLILALVVSIGGQLGDLMESALKRSAGVKDSGHLIPGHGGLLDRFDSFVIALPMVYYGVILFFMR